MHSRTPFCSTVQAVPSCVYLPLPPVLQTGRALSCILAPLGSLSHHCLLTPTHHYVVTIAHVTNVINRRARELCVHVWMYACVCVGLVPCLFPILYSDLCDSQLLEQTVHRSSRDTNHSLSRIALSLPSFSTSWCSTHEKDTHTKPHDDSLSLSLSPLKLVRLATAVGCSVHSVEM